MYYDQYTQRLYEYLVNGDLIDKLSDIIDSLGKILSMCGNILWVGVFGISLYFVLKMLSKGWFKL